MFYEVEVKDSSDVKSVLRLGKEEILQDSHQEGNQKHGQ